MARIDPSMLDGAEQIAERMGRWPSFHDAEVTALELRRGAPSTLAFALADHPDRDRRTRIIFTIARVTGLELSEFNEQNVIFQLELEEGEAEAVRLRLAPCYGLSGWIDGLGIDVRIAAS